MDNNQFIVQVYFHNDEERGANIYMKVVNFNYGQAILTNQIGKSKEKNEPTNTNRRKEPHHETNDCSTTTAIVE